MEGSESSRAAIVNTIKRPGESRPAFWCERASKRFRLTASRRRWRLHISVAYGSPLNDDSTSTVFPFQVFNLTEYFSFAARFLMCFEMLSRRQTVLRPRAQKLSGQPFNLRCVTDR